MTFLSDPFDRFLFLGAFAAVTVITGWAVISLCHDLRRRKVYTESPTLPTLQTLPTVIPAAFLDASDTTDAPQQTYCLACWLDWIGKPWRRYFVPDGTPGFCEQHAKSILAHALDTLHQQQAGEKYR